MDRTQIKEFIEKKVAEGLTLSKIQDELTAQGAKMTFMELRLLASEIESDVFKRQEEKKAAAAKKAEPAPEAPAPAEEEALPEEDFPGEEEELPADAPAEPETPPEAAPENAAPRGKTTVTLSPIQRPGFVASGTVKFGSGPTAEWYLDQTGRLALDKLEGGKPDQQDFMEFQMELRKAFGA